MPSGDVIAINASSLIDMLGEGLRGENRLPLLRSDRALTDCRPVSLISLQTVRQMEAKSSIHFDKRRFRANIYLDFASNFTLPKMNLSVADRESERVRRLWFWNATRAVK